MSILAIDISHNTGLKHLHVCEDIDTVYIDTHTSAYH